MAIIFSLWAPYFHVVVPHHHENHDHNHEQHCTNELEQDACHRRLVHHDFSAQCEHDGHIYETLERCEVCDHFTPLNNYLLSHFTAAPSFAGFKKLCFELRSFPFENTSCGFGNRGPPVWG